MTKRLILVLITAGAAKLSAQAACPTGPGAAFGVTSYQCANCGYTSDKGSRPSYQFFAEPVVIATSPTSLVRAGDVIEAVNDKPITTASGAEQFTYPAAGNHTITVRRGRDRQVLRVAILATDGCEGLPRIQMDDIERIEVIKGPGATARYGPEAVDGVLRITTKKGGERVMPIPPVLDSGRTQIRLNGLRDFMPQERRPLIIVDGVVLPPVNGSFTAPTGRYGFAVSCEASCPSATAQDGPLTFTYYRYSGLPRIAAVRDRSVADRAGVRLGDLVAKVDGSAITSEEAGKALARLEWRDEVRLTVRRGDRELEFVLRVDR